MRLWQSFLATMEIAMKTLSLALILASCAPAHAQETKCGPTKDVYQQLTDKHGESRQVWAETQNNEVIEMWASAKGWTVFVTLPNGQSCLVASGENWGMVPNV